jgi:orotate phosphoribosyltransferase
MLGQKIASRIHQRAAIDGDKKMQCLIGVPTAGNALAQAAALAGAKANNYGVFCHRLMREQLKAGERRGWVVGEAQPERHTYWLLENAITTGRSILAALSKLHVDDYLLEDVKLFALVDRQQGGIEMVQRAGYGPVATVYKLLDLVYVSTKLNYLPEVAFKSLEREAVLAWE